MRMLLSKHIYHLSRVGGPACAGVSGAIVTGAVRARGPHLAAGGLLLPALTALSSCLLSRPARPPESSPVAELMELLTWLMQQYQYKLLHTDICHCHVPLSPDPSL